ncbi:HD domain-containing protein, partial [Deinococcus pimensis]|uniref:HD domain-containing protein n=1 Tax=Deinococcus pimensis TaxID=309888 RepID=UPI000486C4C2
MTRSSRTSLPRLLLGRALRLARSLDARQARPDDAWAAARLTPGERGVYLRMDPRDREHAVRVARHLLGDHPGASPELVAAALLHDAGKSVRRYRVVERVLVGLVPERLCRVLPGGALRVRARHPEIGARLLREAGARGRVADLVERHHAWGGDAEAALL